MPFGPKGLVVTWVGPVPEQAEVTTVDDKVFEAINRSAGREVPRELPAKYLKDLKRVDVFNASIFWDTKSLAAWENRYGIQMDEKSLEIFENYLKEGNVLLGTLVRHPTVAEPQQFVACSVILQRAVIVYANGREDLYLRSYFHSARDSTNFVNFAPAGGLRISFKSESIWFPLELTRVIQEPHSSVVLDILTDAPLDLEQLPKSFHAPQGGTAGLKGKRPKSITFGGRRFHAVRINATLASGERSPDLNLPVHPQ